MKRINLYIPDETDFLVDNLSEINQINRSEVIRKAIELYAEKYTTELNEFTQGLSGLLSGLEDLFPPNNFVTSCMNTPEFFIENAVKIHTRDKGIQAFKLHDFQKKLIYKYDNYDYLIINKSRQNGTTITTLAYILHYCLTHKNKTVVLSSCKLILAQDMLSKIRDMLPELPQDLKEKASTTTLNKRTIEFTNGCKIIATTTSPDAIRGLDIDFIFLDEFAFMPTHIAKEFYETLNVENPNIHMKVIIASTPSGYNFFFKLWADALTNCNRLHPILMPWNQVAGRDIPWTQKQIEAIGLNRFKSEYECEFVNNENKGNLYS